MSGSRFQDLHSGPRTTCASEEPTAHASHLFISIRCCLTSIEPHLALLFRRCCRKMRLSVGRCRSLVRGEENLGLTLLSIVIFRLHPMLSTAAPILQALFFPIPICSTAAAAAASWAAASWAAVARSPIPVPAVTAAVLQVPQVIVLQMQQIPSSGLCLCLFAVTFQYDNIIRGRSTSGYFVIIKFSNAFLVKFLLRRILPTNRSRHSGTPRFLSLGMPSHSHTLRLEKIGRRATHRA